MISLPMALAPDGLMEICYEIDLVGKPMPPGCDLAPLSQPTGLPTITYKPGWTFWWEMRSRPYLCCRIRPPELKAFDCETGEERPISWRWQVPIPVTTQWIWERISGIEFHLRGEWFKVNGKRRMDPHDETTPYLKAAFSGGRI